MKARRALVTAGVVAVIVGMAGAGYAASPSSGKIGPSDTGDGWTGKVFALGAVPSPHLCSQDTCDHYSLTVGVSPGYWNDHTGSASVSISWKDSTDNFDLYVYKGDQLVKSSTQLISKSEGVSFSKPSGTYQVLVVPVLVTDSGNSGFAKFSSKSKPPPPPPPSPPGDGGGGGGSGSGSGGGGSGSYYGPDYSGPMYFPPSYYGGGTVYFGPQDETVRSRQIYYGPTAGSPTASQTPKATVTLTQPVALTVPELPQFVWLLLPIGMIILAAVAYAVFEPEPEIAEEPLPEPEWRAKEPTLTPAPIAAAGIVLRTATVWGKAAHRRFLARRGKRGSTRG
jgi:hypothetical protein